MVVQPSCESVCWCSGSTNGNGDGIKGGLLSCDGRCCSICLGGFQRFESLERYLDMLLEEWSDGFEGCIVTAMITFNRGGF